MHLLLVTGVVMGEADIHHIKAKMIAKETGASLRFKVKMWNGLPLPRIKMTSCRVLQENKANN
ncbi:hypothetical protein RUM43_002050 [Polyplax serrata]|uniref:Uncharacterized protein n=1 Tax=Polyplax serrata TaxID=468196 RepID=A0AAN8RVN2_POLSC